MAKNPKVIQLLRTLHEATSKGHLQWSGGFPEDNLVATVKDARISLTREFAGGFPSYFVYLRDGKSQTTIDVESFSSGEEGFEVAETVFDSIRRSPLHVDEIIDNVIADLSSLANS